MIDPTASLRAHLRDLIVAGNAHLDFDSAVAALPAEMRGAKLARTPHTPWRIVEHMRIAQRDILDFSRNPDHVSPEFPAGYWPEADAPPDPTAWDRTIEAFRADRDEFVALLVDPQSDLFTPFPHGDGQTLLKEALVIADHNAYHLGQLVAIRRALGAWDDEG